MICDLSFTVSQSCKDAAKNINSSNEKNQDLEVVVYNI